MRNLLTPGGRHEVSSAVDWFIESIYVELLPSFAYYVVIVSFAYLYLTVVCDLLIDLQEGHACKILLY